MICEICGNAEATIHIQEILNTKTTEVHLCESCAKNKGLKDSFDSLQFSFVNLINDIVNPQDNTEEIIQIKCSLCNTSYNDFINKRLFGCSECYNSFKDFIPSLLRKLHSHTKHIGKIPSKSLSMIKNIDRIETITKRLKNAVEEENYELAARLRDEIKYLKDKYAKK